MENQKPEALRLAEWCEENSPSIYRQSAETATELRRQHARIQELEAMLESVGAGGVSAQRIRQESDHIAQDLKMVAAPMVLPEPVAVQIRHIKEERWRTIALVLYDLFAGDEYERRYIYTEQQVRDLLAEAACTKSQTTVQEPFGYFKAEPFGWRDCAETDEGAIALYEAPQPQTDARDAERWRFIKRKLCLTGNGDGTCAMQALNLLARILGCPDVGELAIAQFLDTAIDTAIAAAKENKQ